MTSILSIYRSWHIDKVAHILACTLIDYVVADFLSHHTQQPFWLCLVIAVIVTIVVGVGKELLDRKNYGLFDLADLVADGKGIILGTILISLNHYL